MALVKYVEVAKPDTVDRLAAQIDVGRKSIVRLRHGDGVAKIPCIAPAGIVGGNALGSDMQICSAELSRRATAFLKIAAPRETAHVDIAAAGEDVTPPVRRGGGGSPLVEAEGTREAPSVGRGSVDADMPCVAAAPHRGETGIVELENLVETLGVDRDAVPDVMGTRTRYADIAAVHRITRRACACCSQGKERGFGMWRPGSGNAFPSRPP